MSYFYWGGGSGVFRLISNSIRQDSQHTSIPRLDVSAFIDGNSALLGAVFISDTTVNGDVNHYGSLGSGDVDLDGTLSFRKGGAVSVVYTGPQRYRSDVTVKGPLYVESGGTITATEDVSVDGAFLVPNGAASINAQYVAVAQNPDRTGSLTIDNATLSIGQQNTLPKE